MSKLYIFPTDTVYGIGCSFFDKKNINRIYEIKKRDLNKPLAVLCSSLEQIKTLAYLKLDDEKLIRTFLPGALTIILKTKQEVFEKTGYETVGVRIPDCKVALDLIEKVGPMATTSVNDSGEIPLNEYEIIKLKYMDTVDEIIKPDLNFISSNKSSTVILSSESGIKVIRIGDISLDDINEALKK